MELSLSEARSHPEFLQRAHSIHAVDKRRPTLVIKTLYDNPPSGPLGQPVTGRTTVEYLDEVRILLDPNDPKELEEAESLVRQAKGP
jgi:hypothetical protein